MLTLPDGIDFVLLHDRAENFRGRMELLTKNGLIGLALVLLLLSLFLEIRLAFWVAVGIPTAFMGAMMLLPYTGAAISMVSMFAFIVALGIVVDDAIVVGENIYEHRQQGLGHLDAAIQGARDIAVPLAFSILTNIVAFLPLALADAPLARFFFVIPLVVTLAFAFSWLEALFILPAHLAGGHSRMRWAPPLSWIFAAFGLIERVIFKPTQRAFAGGLEGFTRLVYGPMLRLALSWRLVTVALMLAIFLGALGWVLSGRMGFGLFPPIPRDFSQAIVRMPVGSPIEVTQQARDRVVAAAERLIEANGGEEVALGVRSRIRDTTINVRVYLPPAESRPISTREFTSMWRKELRGIPTARSVSFRSSWGGPGATSLEIRLTHTDTGVLEQAAAVLAEELQAYPQVRDTDDGFRPGKDQLEFRITEAGRALGLTSAEVAGQVRSAFFGVEALSQQKGRNEESVRVRRPASERQSEADIETLLIRTPDGGTVPLYEIAEIERSRADAGIDREAGGRIVSVTANVEPRSETSQVLAAVTRDVLPRLLEDHPGLSYSLEGRQASQRQTMSQLLIWSGIALIVIYGLLAIPFRSYFQPAVIMCAIPFGFVGAVIGHHIMGYQLSVISIFGIIALSGVVINAGIVMLDYANKRRAEGVAAAEAIHMAGMRRFRPILLTTITTFCGLAPMIFETSRQAMFLIPMAISLGYGILFATVIVLFLIPALYLVLEDAKAGTRWIFGFEPEEPKAQIPAE